MSIFESQNSGNKTKDLTPKRVPLATYPGSESTKWKPTRAGVVCLGLLSIVLLAGIIGLLVCYIRVTHSLKDNETNSKANLQLMDQGWRYYKSSLYFISTEKKSWEDSKRDCEGRNADLLIINSWEEQVFTHRLNKEKFWIGLNDKVQDGKWMWVDGTELTTGFWGREQPNSDGGNDEDCATQWLVGSVAESWHDAPCNQLHFWICEKRVQL
uniref:C-type lectin domain-containing protein n=1 Tax=Esox lucius TaxID=8010 RepID=A0A3P8ZXT9_ESOLU